MKIIITDNYQTGIRNDRLVAENVDAYYAKFIANLLNEKMGGDKSPDHFVAVPDDYVLFKFEY